MDSWISRNCLREIEGREQRILGRTALLGRQVPLKSHGLSARRAKDFGRRFVSIGLRRGSLLFSRVMHLTAKALLQGSQLAPNGCAKETVIANLHKRMREDMLKETLKKLLDRKSARFKMPAIGSTVLKDDLRTFHAAAVVKRKQATIADGNPMDIGSQILECGLTITNWLTIHDPLLRPDLGRDLLKKFGSLQSASKGSPK